MSGIGQVWRLGHIGAPLDYIDRSYCSWKNRFDDPWQSFRTLYCADEQLTCIREVLADLRPNTAMIADYLAIFGETDSLMGNQVTAEFRRKKVIAPARITSDHDKLIDVDLVPIRHHLERRHAGLLAKHGMAHLDMGQIKSDNRAVSQAIARTIYDDGAHGIIFRSKLDLQRCYALFENRARLEPDGVPIPLTEDLPALLQVCREYQLAIEPCH